MLMRIIHARVCAILLALMCLCMPACTHGRWVRTSELMLEGTRLAVDSSWSLAIEDQRNAEDAAIRAGAARAATATPEERLRILADVEAELARIRERHHAWYDKFALVRKLHAQAVATLEAYQAGGSRALFEQALASLLEAWRALREVLPRGSLMATGSPPTAEKLFNVKVIPCTS